MFNESRDVVAAIVEVIQQSGLKVGERLPTIRELSASLGVKPSLVRDGLLRAQTMGLVRIIPRSGAFLQSLSFAPLVDALASTLRPALMKQDHNLLHLLDARRLVEEDLAARAARLRRLEDLLPVRQALQGMIARPLEDPRDEYVKLDVRFHVEIARLAGNGVLLSMQQALLELLRPHLVQLPWTRERRERTDRSHAAIYDALVAGDAERARHEMHAHLSLAYDSLLRDLETPALPVETFHGPASRGGGRLRTAAS
jgi:GntR family transcriptional repressor for pyruvate dehydrogenase complex